jgi:hypothetical protein
MSVRTPKGDAGDAGSSNAYRGQIDVALAQCYGHYRGLLHARPVVQQGSLLDQAWLASIQYSAATLVWAPTYAAVDALVALHVLWSSSDPSPPTFSASTLLRQAIVGSSTARWVFSDEDLPSIRERLALLALESMSNFAKVDRDRLKSVLRSHPVDTRAREALAHNIKVHEKYIEALARAVFARDAKNAPRYNQLEAIESAASATFPGEEQARRRMVTAWRTMSGDAHALPWARTFRALNNPALMEETATGEGMARLATEFDEYFASLADAIEMLEQAIQLGAHAGFDLSSWLDTAPS